MKEDALSLPRRGIQFYRFLPDGPPRAVIHVVHGLAEHAARYRRLATVLTSDGFAVYAHDQRGHGRTSTGPEDLGHFGDSDGWIQVVEDLRSFILHEKDEHPGVPIGVVAHSMGSFVLQDYLSRYEAADLAAAALSGTSGPPPPIATLGRLVARIERARLSRRGRSALIDKMSFGQYNRAFRPTRTEFDWLSRDPAEVDAYVADPKCGFRATNQTWVELLDALSKLSRPERLARIPKRLPILMISGGQDPLGENGEGVRALADRYRAAGLEDVTLTLYPEARHEIFNETNRDEVMRDLVAWLNERLFQERPAEAAAG